MDDGRRLWLIDWEYGAFGTAMFDLANIAAANSFTPEMEAEMLRAYFGKAPDLSLSRAYYAMKVAAALREAMWGMISELFLAAPASTTSPMPPNTWAASRRSTAPTPRIFPED